MLRSLIFGTLSSLLVASISHAADSVKNPDYPFGGNAIGLSGYGSFGGGMLSYGMIGSLPDEMNTAAEETQKITPRIYVNGSAAQISVQDDPAWRAANKAWFNAESVGAQARLDLFDLNRQKRDLEQSLANALKADNSSLVASLRDQLKDNAMEIRDSQNDIRNAQKDSDAEKARMAELQKKSDGPAGHAYGWSVADKDVQARAKDFCKSSERMIFRSLGASENFGCLDQNGMLTRQTFKMSGMGIGAMPASEYVTSYERKDGKLIVATSIDGKKVMERESSGKDDIIRYFSGDSVTSSCTYNTDALKKSLVWCACWTGQTVVFIPRRSSVRLSLIS